MFLPANTEHNLKLSKHWQEAPKWVEARAAEQDMRDDFQQWLRNSRHEAISYRDPYTIEEFSVGEMEEIGMTLFLGLVCSNGHTYTGHYRHPDDLHRHAYSLREISTGECMMCRAKYPPFFSYELPYLQDRGTKYIRLKQFKRSPWNPHHLSKTLIVRDRSLYLCGPGMVDIYKAVARRHQMLDYYRQDYSANIEQIYALTAPTWRTDIWVKKPRRFSVCRHPFPELAYHVIQQIDHYDYDGIHTS